MKNEKPILLIDANNIAYIAYYSIPDDLSTNEIPTYLIYGFLKNVLNLSKILNSDKMIFCFDSRKSFRKIIYPGYKANRDKNKEFDEKRQEAMNQISILNKNILPYLGFQTEMQTGFEADDIIAKISKDNSKKFIIVSSDKDLFQCLDYHVEQYSPNTKKTYTRQWFLDEYYGIAPYLWHEAKAYAGCPTDEIVGIAGVGEITAMKYIAGLLKHGKKYEAIKANQDIFRRNLDLVCLPFDSNQISFKCQDIEIENGVLFEEPFNKIFKDWNFISFLKNMNEWRENFNLI